MAKSEVVSEKPFSYDEVDKDTAAKLRYCALEINKHRNKIASSLLEIGKQLTIAHEAEKSTRTFLRWVDKEWGFSASTAYRYMDASRVFQNVPNVGSFEDSAMFLLAQKDTPETALKEALKLAENGKITQKQAKEIIKKHKTPVASSSSTAATTATAPTTTATVTSKTDNSKNTAKVDPPKNPEPEYEDVEDPEDEISEEPEAEEEPTVAEICEADNKAIESFCRNVVKHFNDNVPKLPWTEDSGRIESALQSIKAGLTTLRGAKAEVCPACVDGMTEKGKCRYCKGHGYLPTYFAGRVPQEERR